MTIDEFLRILPIRAPNVAWFLGAGASASAGLPTAGDLIWQFKRGLYCAAQKVSLATCEDLGSFAVRSRLQAYLDQTKRFPAAGAPEEYSSFFEATYPDAADRRRYIDRMLQIGKPAFGHHVLAALMRLDKVRLVWTTNFDRLVEDASAVALGTTGKLVVATLDSNDIALQAMNEGRWPLLGKLHGDFQSVSLKNTNAELQHQDAQLRSALVESCKRFGLAVVGYSGRDNSVMSALEEAVADGRGFPSGLFWFCRAETPLNDRVHKLIDRANSIGSRAHIIEVETFDELMGDAIKQFPDIPPDILSSLGQIQSRVSNVPIPRSSVGWPVIRLNAVPVESWPQHCRKFDCRIGGAKDLREHLILHPGELVAARSSAGVLAFGSDAEIHRVFDDLGISNLGLHSIEVSRLWRETNEMNLLRQALVFGLARNLPLRAEGHRSHHLLRVVEDQANDKRLKRLSASTQQISGTIPGTPVHWAEAVRVKLEYKLGRLWLLLEPSVWFGNCTSDEQHYRCNDFVRERMARRYNSQFNSVLDAWIELFVGEGQENTIAALNEQPGISAPFTLLKRTGFTRRAQ